MNHLNSIRKLDWWQDDIRIMPLEGGITNHNYLVNRSSDETTQYVVRLGDDIPVHHILRFNELAASEAAHAAGLSPAIRHHQPGVLIMDYIPSRALEPADIREQAVLEQLVSLIQRCHRDVPRHLRGASVVFWVFHVIRDYAATLKAGASPHVPKLAELLNAADLLEQHAGPFDIVFGHNDLLAANILDDGERLWLVDWEYGGFNSPLFDLGGLASNNALSEAQQRWLLQAYFDTDVSDALWCRYQAMKTASLLRETMWSMVSEQHSTVDFDYAAYSTENLQRFESSMQHVRELIA